MKCNTWQAINEKHDNWVYSINHAPQNLEICYISIFDAVLLHINFFQIHRKALKVKPIEHIKMLTFFLCSLCLLWYFPTRNEEL